MEYPKINTLFKRDENSIIIPSEYTLPEFEYLKYCPFECTEKIDGTNIRIIWDGHKVSYYGRTDTPYHLQEIRIGIPMLLSLLMSLL